jgi:PAS domain S-box-containing protein
MFQFRSISTKFILFISLLIVLSVGVFVGIIVELGKQSRSSVKETNEALMTDALQKEWEEKGRAMASLLSIQFVQPMYELDVSKMQSMASLTLKEKRFDYIYVLDSKGTVLVDASEGHGVMGQVLTDKVSKTALAAGDVIAQRSSNTVDIAAPIVAGTKRLGVVRIGFSTEGIKETTAIMTSMVGDSIDQVFAVTMKKVLFLLPVIVFPAVVIGWFLARGLTVPIRELVLGTEKIAKGDLGHLIKIESTDEIGQLASAFNKMTGDLQRTTVSRNYVDNIIQSMADTLIVVDSDGTIETVNLALCDLLGYEKEEVIGKPVATVFAKEEQARMGQVFGDFVKQGRIHNVDTIYVSREGRKTPVSFAGSVMRGADGKIRGLICVATNVTERKRMEEVLHNSEERYKRLARMSPDIIFTVDPDGMFTFLSEAVRDLGYEPEELVGKHFSTIMPPDEVEAVSRSGVLPRYTGGRAHGVDAPKLFDERRVGERKTKNLEISLLTKDAERQSRDSSEPVSGRRVVEVTTSGLYTEDADTKEKTFLGTIGVLRDITARKRAEKEFEKTMEELGRSNAELEQFAYVASHDLKEPLAVILGYLQQIKRHSGGTLEEKVEGFVDRAMEGTVRLESLINGLLVYSRIGAGGEELKPTDCSDIIKWVLGDLKTAVDESDGEVAHSKLPTVMADPTQLGQLFQNLIGNAVKFHGDTPPKVHISAVAKGREWQFSVRDNGIGINPKDINHIFDIFRRMHDRKTYPGTGIGLSICKKIVERHGGRIWVESEPGKGSTFHFTILRQS